jgi:hypothetical protein
MHVYTREIKVHKEFCECHHRLAQQQLNRLARERRDISHANVSQGSGLYREIIHELLTTQAVSLLIKTTPSSKFLKKFKI